MSVELRAANGDIVFWAVQIVGWFVFQGAQIQPGSWLVQLRRAGRVSREVYPPDEFLERFGSVAE